MALVKTPRPFETEPCGRCGGSGTNSYCEMWGTTCFDCGVRRGEPGTGRRLTKRGKMARDFYLSLMPTKTVADLIPGDLVSDIGFRDRVVEIVPTTSWSIDAATGQPKVDPATLRDVRFTKSIYSGLLLTRVFRLVPTVEQADAAYAKAIAYQATLTKTGTVAKRKEVK